MDEARTRRQLRGRRLTLAGLAALLLGLWLLNASWLAPTPQGRPIVIAHRGIYQQFSHEGLGRYDCTATRIFKPVHPFLENTIPSMRKAFHLGADIVELDVAPTRDGDVMVFHDWFLDCRTDGHGEIRDHTKAELEALDVGYGYTADGGRTFPFRGRGIGLMPTLEEVLHAFPGKSFLINFKSRDPAEADAVTAAFRRAGVAIDEHYSFYGDGPVLDRMRRLAPRSWIWGVSEVKACNYRYLSYGWTGLVPAACRGRTIAVPLNLRGLAWGWPDRFLARMEDARAHVILTGSAGNPKAPTGLARPEQLAKVPSGFSGIVWVEDIHALRAALRRRPAPSR